MKQQITLRVLCENLPGTRFGNRIGVRLGVQKNQAVINDVPATKDASATFTVLLDIAEKNEGEAPPRFLGPFAQGTPDARFLYLCWGERHDKAPLVWDGFRRAKLLLRSLSWEIVEKALAAPGRVVEARVCATDHKGGPLCGSIPPDQVTWTLPGLDHAAVDTQPLSGNKGG